MRNDPVLKSLTLQTKDGEWGKDSAFDSSIQMAVIRGTDFDDVRIGDLSGVPIRYIPEHIAKRKVLQPYDLLIETAGGTKGRPTGRTLLIKSSLLSKSELPVTCASFARFIRIDQRKVDPVYLFWLLQHLYRCGVLAKYHTQHTGVARFQFTTFSEREPLPLPSRIKQEKVASILLAYDDMIENNTRRIKILEEMAQMIYREWFVRFRFPAHEKVNLVPSEIGLIPNNWTVLKIGDVLQYDIGGGWGAEKSDETYTVPAHVIRGTDIPEVRMGNLKCCPLRFHKESNANSRRLQDGDIVFEVSGGSKGQPVGRALLMLSRILSAFEGDAICASFCKLLRPNPSKIGSVHLYEFLLESYTNGLIEKYQVQSTGITNFKLGVFLEDAKIAVPSEQVRLDFERLSSPLLDSIAVLGLKNAVLSQTRDLLLPRLISGEISVEHFETETASQIS